MTSDELKQVAAILKEDQDFLKKVRGPAGVGITGNSGATGPQGEKGKVGPQGNEGKAGDPGDKGKIGDTGPQGLEGIQGPIGLDGQTGPQGPPGNKGNKGDDGKDGFQGPMGGMGPQGERGPAGEAGESGKNVACRAVCAQPIDLDANVWTIVKFGDHNWDDGHFHSKATNTEFLGLGQSGTYFLSATVLGVDKINIVHIDSNDKEVPVATGEDSCSTLVKANRFDKFRVEVFCNKSVSIQPNAASPVFIITKLDHAG